MKLSRASRIIFFYKIAGQTLSLLLNTKTLTTYLHQIINQHPHLSEKTIKKIIIETANQFFNTIDDQTLLLANKIEDLFHEILHFAVDDTFAKFQGKNNKLSSVLDEIFITKIVDPDVSSWREDYEYATLEWLMDLIKEKVAGKAIADTDDYEEIGTITRTPITLLQTIEILNQEADKLTPAKKDLIKRTLQQILNNSKILTAHQVCKLLIQELTNKIDILTPFYSEKVEARLKMFLLLLNKRLSETK